MSSLKTIHPLSVFISSPSDVRQEREIASRTVALIAQMPHIRRRCTLRVLDYSKNSPPVVGQEPQSIIDRFMGTSAEADIVICILWSRMGTPISILGEQYNSGTEYEFLTAYQARKNARRQGEREKPYILLYRCHKPPPENADVTQLAKVEAFFRGFSETTSSLCGLYKNYSTCEEFREMIIADLAEVVERILHRHWDVEEGRVFWQVGLHYGTVGSISQCQDEVRRILFQSNNDVVIRDSWVRNLSLDRANANAKTTYPWLSKPRGAEVVLTAKIGPTPNLFCILDELLRQLGNQLNFSSGLKDKPFIRLEKALGEQESFIILDDVHRIDDIAPLLTLPCRIVVITSKARIARRLVVGVSTLKILVDFDCLKTSEGHSGKAIYQLTETFWTNIVLDYNRMFDQRCLDVLCDDFRRTVSSNCLEVLMPESGHISSSESRFLKRLINEAGFPEFDPRGGSSYPLLLVGTLRPSLVKWVRINAARSSGLVILMSPSGQELQQILGDMVMHTSALVCTDDIRELSSEHLRRMVLA